MLGFVSCGRATAGSCDADTKVSGGVQIEGYGFFFFFKQETAYEMRISDWGSDVCASDLEITYPLHVILRTRLERALLSGDLTVADLPAAWGEGMRTLLGVIPPDDARGCLQDIHWYDGDRKRVV